MLLARKAACRGTRHQDEGYYLAEWGFRQHSREYGYRFVILQRPEQQ
jgi:hypothetical protein